MSAWTGIDQRCFGGNYNTGMSGTELSAYNRSLYGFKLDYRSSDKTQLNEDQHTFKTFGLRAQY